MKNSKKQAKSLFGAYKDKSIIFRIAFTGMFLGLVILFQYLERFMPFADTYLKLNFSLLFILPIFYFAGPLFGISVLGIRFVIGASFGSLGWTKAGMTGQLILLVSTIVVILFMFLYSHLFKNVASKRMKLLYISLATVVSASLVLTVLNGIWFTPMFWWAFGYIDSISISKAINTYSYVTGFFFGIPNYWGGVFAVYLTGNIIKFGLVYLIYFPLAKAIEAMATKSQASWHSKR